MNSVVWTSKEESSSTPEDRSTPSRWGWLLFWPAAVAIVAVSGAQFTPDAWYQSLRKPSFNPPGAVFGPVWTVLYLLMAIAAWLVAKQVQVSARLRRRALWLMGLQLLLNGLWSPLFFGLHNPALAFVDISALWIALVATIASFASVRPLAAWLLVPYLLWVSFALVLNGSIWLMN